MVPRLMEVGPPGSEVRHRDFQTKRPGHEVADTGLSEQHGGRDPFGGIWGVHAPESFRTSIDLDRTVIDLFDRWVEETRFLSDLDQIYGNRQADKIVSLGEDIVPIAIDRIESEPERWSYLLRRVTGEDPIGSDTTRENAGRVWREWAAQRAGSIPRPQV